MEGFGSAIFSQGTYGKGVMLGQSDMDASATVKTFGVAEWMATHTHINSLSVLKNFGGIFLGGNTLMQSVTNLKSHPNMIWAGFETSTNQSIVSTSGHIAWDSQLVDSTTWTTQIVD